ncbi:MAG: efflux RND transporter permease subunit [Oscillospiraceae bacterium]
MKKLYTIITDNTKLIIVIFLALFFLCLFLQNYVTVNYDINDYLPESSHSTVSLEIMEKEFEGGIPNARVMVRGISIPEALKYKERILEVTGVTGVTWLDDVEDTTIPLQMMDKNVVDIYYKDNAALFTVIISESNRIEAVDEIRGLIGENNPISGSAVSTADATTSIISEVKSITIFGVLFALLVLVLTTKSWFEPIFILGGIGIAIIMNAGTNLIFGEISFVTSAAGKILQLAVSLDYSVFLMHRFEECRREQPDTKKAMVDALCKSTTSILSSGLTTVIGFLALTLMRFKIGPDLGLVLAKGVFISLITVFIFMPALILVTYKLLDKTTHRSFMPNFKGFGKFVFRVMIPMVFIFFIVMIPANLASNSNSFYYGSSMIFGDNTKLGVDTSTIEDTFGQSDTYVLLVPKGNTPAEKELSNELKTIPQVASIISYVDMVEAEIPTSYLDEETLSKLISENYSRMAIAVNANYEGDETFKLIEKIRDISYRYYQDTYYLAGEGVSTYDLMDTVTSDIVMVNIIAIGAVFIVLLFATKNISLPIILVLSIETAIWLNLAVPYFMGSTIFYIAYLIISSIQLGATVDYTILLTDRYKECRQYSEKKEAIIETLSAVTVSILTSGSVLTVAGFLLGYVSSHGLLSQLGMFLGKGTLFSMAIVLFVLPGLLYIFDGFFIRNSNNKKQKNDLQEVNIYEKHN